MNSKSRTKSAMTYINPITAATVAATPTQQAQLAADKARQIRQQQAAARNIAASGDRVELTVENAEAIAPVGDEPPREPPPRQRKPRSKTPEGDDEGDDSEEPHIDLRA